MTHQNDMNDAQVTTDLERRDLLKLAGVGAAALGVLSPTVAASAASAQETAAGVDGEGLSVIRLGVEPTAFGPQEQFTGRVRIESLFQAEEPARVGGGVITFDPGARTAWHSHPLGQTLIVTAGICWLQEEGHEIVELRPGDIAWIRPEVKHWHGASPDMGMTHIAIAEALDGQASTWMELVTDEQYSR